MFRELILSSFKLFILILICNFFLRGQELNFISNTPFQNCWESAERIATKAASDNETKIFIPLQMGIIKAIDTNKNEIWSTDLGGVIMTQPIYQDETLYVLSKTSRAINKTTEGESNIVYSVSALDTDSGVSKWKKEYKSEQTPVLSSQKSRLIIALTKKNNGSNEKVLNFTVLDGHTGEVIFEKTYDFEAKLFFDTSSERMVILTSSNSIVSLSVLDGNIAFFNTSIKSIQAGSTFGKGILISNDRGVIYFVDSTGEENKFKIRLGAKATDITYHKNNILISSLDNFIYSLSPDGKQINWKRRFAGRIIEKPVINKDAVIAYSQGDNSLYFLNYDDGKVFNRITVVDEEEIIGSPLLLNNLVIVTTSKGIKAFSLDACKNLTAAER